MSLFAIGDLHLAKDPSLEKPMDVFGPAWENHEERLEAAWRETVSPEDTVIVAGDISWALKLEEAMADLRFISELPGQKILLKGNHDLWWHGITRLNNLFNNMYFLQNTCYELEDVILCGSRGWVCPGDNEFSPEDRKIYERELLRLRASLEEGVRVNKEKGESKELLGILHYPPTNPTKEDSGFTELFEEFGVKRVVYGHLHGPEAFPKGLKGEKNGVNYTLVSLDYLGCVPLKLD